MKNKLYFDAVVKSLKEGEFEVVASNAKVDRFGDTINPDGWVLTNYRKNPVILWAHSTGGFAGPAIPPVARATKIRIEDEQLKVKGVFAPTPFAQELRTLVEGGFLKAVSVGFIPLVSDEKGMVEIEGKMYRRANEQELKDFEEKGCCGEGTKFEKQELLEVSWVNVPALPSALVSAKEMGLQLITKELEIKVEDIEIKEGRVISERNRKLINNCLKQMGVAIDALKALLDATEPEKDITPEVKRSQSKGKVEERAKSPELRTMLLANKAVEASLSELKDNKLERKTEIYYLRIASKVVDAAIIKLRSK